MKKVAIVILNYKVCKLVLKCIESVKKSSYQNLEVIVLDNNSRDGLGEEIRKFQDVKFVQNMENLGYTGGNNIGIKLALQLGVDFVLVFNPDVTLDKNCIGNLVEAAEKSGAGVLGPKIYFSGTKKIWHAGGVMDTFNVVGSHRGVDQKDEGQFEKLQEVDFVSGAAFFVKREVFEKVGLFDERYFLYYEDADFCKRAKNGGFKVIYVPGALVLHENAKSAGLGSPLQDYYMMRNRMLYASKFLPFRTRFALFREALKNIGNSTRRLAFFDFIIGNLGKGSFKI